MSSAEETKDQHGGRSGRRLVTIFVNSRPHEVEGSDISFDEVVKIAYPTAPYGENSGYSVMYEFGRGGKVGTLVAGQSVKVEQRMRFDVTATDLS